MPAQPLNRICYVEDDEDIQRIVRMSLERIGKMTVEVVGDPTAAIERIKVFKPDLVMLDWMMPVMDGPTLFRRMREVPETSALPVVFITAKASQRELDELRKKVEMEEQQLTKEKQLHEQKVMEEKKRWSFLKNVFKIQRGNCTKL